MIGRISDTSNYVKNTSNILIGRISDTSNYVTNTSNILHNRISDTSNYVTNTSNILVGRISDTSNYVTNTSNILIEHIRDTSNYVASTSNILIDAINNKSKWTTSNNMIYYNTSNVGIGTYDPTSKLHLYDDFDNITKLIVQNNVFQEIISSPPADISGIITDSITDSSLDKYMIFKSTGTNYVFTIPTRGINCDILMIGGGGCAASGGGGAGACIVAVNQILPAGIYTVIVGIGGNAYYVPETNNYPPNNGGDSSISINEGGTIRYLARGGGHSHSGDGGCGGSSRISTYVSGGNYVSTNIVNSSLPNISPTGPITTGLNYAVLGNAGGDPVNNGGVGWSGGGGGIGSSGQLYGVAGDGINQVTINSKVYNFRSHFANNDNTFGKDEGYIGGGGGGVYYNPDEGFYVSPGGKGGGVVIIRIVWVSLIQEQEEEIMVREVRELS